MERPQEEREETHREMEEKLESLRAYPSRDPRAVVAGRKAFLSEVDELRAGPELGLLGNARNWLRRTRDQLSVRPALRPVMAGLLAMALFLAGATGTAYASQNAVPGGLLYPVKTSLESLRLALTADPAAMLELRLSFAEQRMEEVSALVAQGSYEDLGSTLDALAVQLAEAGQLVEVLAQSGSPQYPELSLRYIALLIDFNRNLTALLQNIPVEEQPLVEQAITVTTEDDVEITGVVQALTETSITVNDQVIAITEQTEIEGTIAVGDTVTVYALQSADGTLTAREIELADELDDGGDEDNSDLGGEEAGEDKSGPEGGEDDGGGEGEEEGEDDESSGSGGDGSSGSGSGGGGEEEDDSSGSGGGDQDSGDDEEEEEDD